MFSNPLDPPSVREARRVEEAHIARWIEEARGRGRHGGGTAGAHGLAASAIHAALLTAQE